MNSAIGIVRWLEDLDSDASGLAGEKATQLGQLIRSGINVPPGFIWLSNYGDGVMDSSRKLSVPTSVLFKFYDILNVARVAVRSSGISEDSSSKSWAGINDTFLNVPREQLIEKATAVRKGSSRSSLYTKAGERKALSDVGVIVQAMISADISGVAFSRNPVTQASEVIIEAIFGMCAAMASGEATPERWSYASADAAPTVTRSRQSKMRIPGADGTGDILVDVPLNLLSKNKLTEAQAKDILSTVIALEKNFGYPVDIEWAIVSPNDAPSSSTLYILQCRPITTLANTSSTRKSTYKFWFAEKEKLWRSESTLRVHSAQEKVHSDCFDFLRLVDAFCCTQDGSLVEFFINPVLNDDMLAENKARVLEEAFERNFVEAFRILESQKDELFQLMVDSDFSRRDLWTDAQLCDIWKRCMNFHHFALSLYPVSGPLITESLQHAIQDICSFEEMAVLLATVEDDLSRLEFNAFNIIRGTTTNNNLETDELLMNHVQAFPYLAYNYFSLEEIIEQLRKRMCQEQSTSVVLSASSKSCHTERSGEGATYSAEQAEIIRRHPDVGKIIKFTHFVSLSRMRIKNCYVGM